MRRSIEHEHNRPNTARQSRGDHRLQIVSTVGAAHSFARWFATSSHSACSFLWSELETCAAQKRSAVVEQRGQGGGWRLRSDVRVHMFVNQTPCGDASIFQPATTGSSPSVASTTEDCNDVGPEKADPDRPTKRRKHSSPAEDDAHRTGAKPVPGEPADPKGAGGGYHAVGVLRCKPGRGDPTLSMSCSDKISRWTVVGCQVFFVACCTACDSGSVTITFNAPLRGQRSAFDGSLCLVAW